MMHMLQLEGVLGNMICIRSGIGIGVGYGVLCVCVCMNRERATDSIL